MKVNTLGVFPLLVVAVAIVVGVVAEAVEVVLVPATVNPLDD